MRKILFLVIMILGCVFSMSSQDSDYSSTDTGKNELIPNVKGEEFVYQYVDDEKTMLRLIDPHHEGYMSITSDAFSYYHMRIIDVPEYEEIDGRMCKVVSIGGSMFNAPVFDEVTLPSTVFIIDSGAFILGSFDKITFSEGLKIIDDYTFGYSKVPKLDFPKSLYSIGERCFYCFDISEINFADGLFKIGNESFSINNKIEEVKLPRMLGKLGSKCFNECPKLKKVYIPKFPSNINECFNDCPAIEEIECANKYPIPLKDSFKDVDKTKCRVIVPDGSRERYLEADGWRDFILVEKSEVSSAPVIDGANPKDDVEAHAKSKIYTLDGIELNSEEKVAPGTVFIIAQPGKPARMAIRGK